MRRGHIVTEAGWSDRGHGPCLPVFAPRSRDRKTTKIGRSLARRRRQSGIPAHMFARFPLTVSRASTPVNWGSCAMVGGAAQLYVMHPKPVQIAGAFLAPDFPARGASLHHGIPAA
ncbi:MAG: hypothetical protein IMZ61_14515 [Planctomycetes bacterium]|nr:hypothetical protein [Planctomycetota bacterium]